MAVILTVDEDARIRELLGVYLAREGHRTVGAGGGEQAVELAAEHRPDLVLLDVLLPDIDGFETTRRLKRQSGGDFLPVILLTALDDVQSRVAGYRAGADEFLAKPVHRAELLSRVANLLAVREERRALARSHAALLELQRYKENLTQLLIHDLKNPLSALAANLEYARQELAGAARADVLDSLDDSLHACGRLQHMVINLLDVGRLEEGQLELRRSRVRLGPMIAALARAHAREAQDRAVTLDLGTLLEDTDDVELDADADVLCRVVENLIESALRLSLRGGRIALSARVGGAHVQLRVAPGGGPLPAELRDTLFDKYAAIARAEGQPRLSRGLGLYFCRLAVEAHGGRIFVEGGAERAVFVVELPVTGISGNR